MNKIVVNFNTCTPAPSGGYQIKYRVAGSSGEYTNAGYFFTSPAIFYDTLNPAGTCYEGFIRTDCGVMGNPVNWESCISGDPTVIITGTVALYCSGAGSSVEGRAGFIFNFSNPSDVDIPVQMTSCINGGGAYPKTCNGVVFLGGTLPPGYTDLFTFIGSFTIPGGAALFDTGVIPEISCYSENNPNYPELHPKYLYFKPDLPVGYSLVLTSTDPQYTIVII